MHLVESVGTGIPRIARILSEDEFPPAEYKTEGFFTTILRKKKTSSTEQAGDNKEKSKEKSKEKTEEKVLRLITSNPRITTAVSLSFQHIKCRFAGIALSLYIQNIISGYIMKIGCELRTFIKAERGKR